MKALLLASTIALAFVPAKAADMPVKVAPRSAPVVTCYFCGYYVGVHGGGAWARDNFSDEVGELFGNFKIDGGFVGGHAGHNWQAASPNIILGVEIDYDWLFGSRRNNFNLEIIRGDLAARYPVPDIHMTTKVDALASARARVGFLFTPTMMIYATGGFALGHVRSAIVEEFIIKEPVPAAVAPAPRSITFNAAAVHFGWVAGGGLEWAMTPNWFLRVQGLHYDLNDAGYAFLVTNATAKLTVDTVSGGLSYRW
jgi:outer membrane immunogenic protein